MLKDGEEMGAVVASEQDNWRKSLRGKQQIASYLRSKHHCKCKQEQKNRTPNIYQTDTINAEIYTVNCIKSRSIDC